MFTNVGCITDTNFYKNFLICLILPNLDNMPEGSVVESERRLPHPVYNLTIQVHTSPEFDPDGIRVIKGSDGRYTVKDVERYLETLAEVKRFLSPPAVFITNHVVGESMSGQVKEQIENLKKDPRSSKHLKEADTYPWNFPVSDPRSDLHHLSPHLGWPGDVFTAMFPDEVLGEARSIRAQYPPEKTKERGFYIAVGAEIELSYPEGKLDIPEIVLREMDCVIVARHLGTNEDTDKTTQLITVLSNPYVDLIAHPQHLDWVRFLPALTEADVILEITPRNADEFLSEGGVLAGFFQTHPMEATRLKFAIDLDFHAPQNPHTLFSEHRWRRATYEALTKILSDHTIPPQKLDESVVNTWTYEKWQEWRQARITRKR